MQKNDREFLAQKIRTQYTEQKYDRLDALKALDKKVKRPANIFAYLFGSLGAVIMGGGMSLVMTDIGAVLGMSETMMPGIGIGVVGMVIAIVNYPIYKHILAVRRRKYAEQIVALSDELMQD